MAICKMSIANDVESLVIKKDQKQYTKRFGLLGWAVILSTLCILVAIFYLHFRNHEKPPGSFGDYFQGKVIL